MFYARAEATYDLSDPFDLIEFSLQLVDLVEDVAESCNLGVGHLYGIARSIVLRLRRPLGGLVEL